METLGLLAATLTTTAFLPQAIRTIRTRDTSGISLAMYVVLEAGILLWIVYGVHFDLTPVWLGNFVTGLFAGVILFLKLRERPGTVPTPDADPTPGTGPTLGTDPNPGTVPTPNTGSTPNA